VRLKGERKQVVLKIEKRLKIGIFDLD